MAVLFLLKSTDLVKNYRFFRKLSFELYFIKIKSFQACLAQLFDIWKRFNSQFN